MRLVLATLILAVSLGANGLPVTDLPYWADFPQPWSDPQFPEDAFNIAIGNAPQDEVFHNQDDSLIGYWDPDINPLFVEWSPVDTYKEVPYLYCGLDPSPVPEPGEGAMLVIIFGVFLLVGFVCSGGLGRPQ